jgi:D-xylose transport system permease protein
LTAKIDELGLVNLAQMLGVFSGDGPDQEVSETLPGIKCFVLMGILYGVSGVLITAQVGASTASSGLFLELDAIRGSGHRGISLRGGVGTVTVAMVGAVLLATIDNGMSILNVSAFLQMVVKGFLLLSALSMDFYMMKRRRV